MVYPYNGVLLSSKEKQNTCTSNNVDESILRFHLYDIWKRQGHRNKSGLGIGGGGLTAKRHEETFWSDGNVLYLYCGGGNMLTSVKICLNLIELSVKMGESITSKLYFS